MTRAKLIESTKLLIQKYNDLVRELSDEERSKIMLKSLDIEELHIERKSRDQLERFNKSVLDRINELKLLK